MTIKGKSQQRLRPRITAERARDLLDYDPDTGAFRWKALSNSKSRAVIGGSPGNVNERGYLRLVVAGKNYQAHRLAWLYVHGVWPEQTVDHINGNKLDNRIANLRDISSGMNTQNKRRPQGKNPLIGVCRSRNKWQASIRAGETTVYLGRYTTPEAAHEAYVKAKRQLHPGNTL